METTINYMTWSMDDIVFDNRNKDYGAYELRQVTKKNVRTGLIWMTFGLVTLVLFAEADWDFLKPKADKTIETVATLTDPPPLDKTPPPPPPPPPPKLTRPTIKFVEMVVRKQQQIHEDDPPPMVPKDEKIDISGKTQEGDINATEKMEEPPVISSAPAVDEQTIFTFVEQPAEYPGGEGELIKFLQKNIRYPQMESDNDIQGKVLIRFVVMEDGSVSDVNVMRGISPGLDKEAVRVVKMLAKFKPGKQQGKVVKQYFNLPVYFKLQ